MADANWNTDITTNNANLSAGMEADSVTIPADVFITDRETQIEAGTVNLFSPLELEEQDFIVSMEAGAETYTGPTTIIPAQVEQAFETKNKICRQNLIVEEIPYSQVSNPAGGWTVTIA